MLWFWLSLAAALLWSINNHLDKYLAERYYRDTEALPGTLMFLTSILGAGIAITIFLVDPSRAQVPLVSALLMLLAGVLDFVYVFPYILALMRDEASRVAPLFQLAPVITFGLGWFILHEHIAGRQILAAILVVSGAIAINLDLGSGFRVKKSVLGFMALAASLWALETFLFKFVGTGTGYWSAVLYQYLGVAMAGLALASVNPHYRRSFSGLIRNHGRSVATLSVLAEALNATARLSLGYASLLAPLAVVTLVASTSPFFVIAIGIVITLVAPRFGHESISGRHLSQKIAATAVICGGTYLLLTK